MNKKPGHCLHHRHAVDRASAFCAESYKYTHTPKLYAYLAMLLLYCLFDLCACGCVRGFCACVCVSGRMAGSLTFFSNGHEN